MSDAVCLSDKSVLPFKQWMGKREISLLGCYFGLNSESVRGVFAAKNLPIGEVVVSVPDAEVIMSHTCSIGDSLEAAELCNSSDDPQCENLGLVIAVMAEKCLGSQSRWAAYLDFLPGEMSGMPMLWNKKEMQPLRHTSLAAKLEGKWQMSGCHVEAPSQVEDYYSTIVLPFMKNHFVAGFPRDTQQQHQLYLWATAVVSAYSFTLGEDKFQAMVPLWDMLNHVTGQCNVRLHHNPKRGALQMIATKPIKQGQEIINNYGPLSDAELLRRFGFIDSEPNLNNGCEIPFAMLRAKCQELLQPVQMQVSEAAPQQSDGTTAASLQSRQSQQSALAAEQLSAERALLLHKVEFIQKHDLIPSDGWFKSDILGQPQCEMIEAVRILLLSPADFKAFKRQVNRWHCPLTRPLTQLTSISHQVSHVIHSVASEWLAVLAEPVQSGMLQSLRQTAAQAVLVTERRALLGLQLWIDKHDSISLINCSKKVWMHIR